MRLFKKVGRMFSSTAHEVIDEHAKKNPIPMFKEGLRELEDKYKTAFEGLAKIKGMALISKKAAEACGEAADELEKKAALVVDRISSGAMDAVKGEELATKALTQAEEKRAEQSGHAKTQHMHQTKADQTEKLVTKLKKEITDGRNEIKTLEAQHQTNTATAEISKTLSSIDSSSTRSMLERARAQVADSEAVATAYGEMSDIGGSVEDELDAALGELPSSSVADKLAALKARAQQ